MTGQPKMDTQTWTRLLEFLGDPSGGAYLEVRARLESFFRWKAARDPEALADETLLRVAQKVGAGEQIEATPSRYALGVARFVWLETVKSEVREREAVARQAAEAPPEPDSAHEDRLAALERCLEGLEPADRDLIRRYHAEQGQKKIDGRKALATEVGSTLNALRIRAFKIRARLEKCVEAGLSAL